MAIANITNNILTDSGVATSSLLTTSAAASTYQTILTNPVTGTGTTNYLPKFTGTSSIANSIIYDNSGNVLINTTDASIGHRLAVYSATEAAQLRVMGLAPSVLFTESTTNTNSYSAYLGIATSVNNFVTGTGIGDYVMANNSNYPLVFATNGSIKMKMFANGNLAVGTTTDSGYKLDVNGTGRFSGALTGTSATFSGVLKNTGDLIVSQGNNGSWTGKGLAMAYSVGSDTGLLYSYDYTGGVYKPIKIIGSTIVLQVSAIEALTIASTGAATFSSTIKSSDTNGFAIGSIASFRRIQYGSDAATAFSLLTDTNSYAGLYAGAATFSSSVTAQSLDIISASGVGSSTASGLARFITAGTSTAISVGQSNQTRRLDIGTYYINVTGEQFELSTASAQPLIFNTNATERMRITSGGNVLIGTTTNTSHKLTVYNATAAGQVRITGAAPTVYFTDTVTDPANYVGLVGLATATNNFFTGTAAGDFVMYNQVNGYKLFVVNYSGGVYLTSGATSWTANSDIRLKNINSHIENAVEKLSTLQTINFSYKDDKFKKQNLGLIAQEVEKIFPELIDKNNDGMLGVRYTELVPVLVKAIQEQQLQIEELKLKIK
jgi:hypothetical protein